MPEQQTLLQNALILDTETTGLTRGSGLHELAIYDLEQQKIHEYVVKPNYVETYTNPLQEHTKLASSPGDLHIGQAPDRWMDVFRAQLVMDDIVGKHADDVEVMRALKEHSPFLHNAILSGKHPHLQGKAESPTAVANRRSTFAKSGVALESDTSVVEDILAEGGPLQRAIRGATHRQGRTVWIANAAFEAKQIGAQLGAIGDEAASVIKGSLETSSGSPDPFYVTGAEVNLARSKAQMSGDWTQVHKAYKKHVPRAGETAVRDIQDILRSIMSYGHQLGLTDTDDPYFGTGIDISSRVMGSMDADKTVARKNLMTPELHRAAEDVLVESNVLHKAAGWADVLEHVQDDSSLGQQYKTQAMRGEGPLAEVSSYLSRLDVLRPEMQRSSLVKRLVRAEVDFTEKGKTFQRGGVSKIIPMKQSTPGGAERTVIRLQHERLPFADRDSLSEHIKSEKRYGNVNIDAEMQAVQDYTAGASSKVDRRRLLSQYLEEQTGDTLDRAIKTHADTMLTTSGRKVSQWSSSGRAFGGALDALETLRTPTTGKAGLAIAAGITVAGMAATAIGRPPVKDDPSVVTYNYQQWLDRQNSFSGQRGVGEQMQGMSHRGVAGEKRKHNTDFGSPYQGIQGSQLVFHDQELLKERENFLRQQYGAKHFDPKFGLHGAFGPFKAAYSKSNSMFTGGTPVQQGKHAGLRGDLLEIDFSDKKWKMSVEDADTIVVKRGGIRGGVSSFFGMNKGYSFRLAGIDAPETSHGGTGYHAPQPGADAATTVLNNLVHGSNKLSLVYDPSQVTYGRMMGVVLADGKNINLEMVKQGNVAALPFYAKGRKPMVDYAPFVAAETRAHQAGKGIWSQPYYQAFRDATQAADQSVTFNTLTRKSKLVQNVWKMDMLSMMEQSQAQGFYNSASAIEASRIGGGASGFKADNVKPVLFSQPHSHYNTHLSEMMRDVGTWNKSRGSKHQQNKFSSKGGYGKLDKTLVLDSMSGTDNIWNKRRSQAFNRYGSGKSLQRSRKARMAEEQRRINQRVFDGGVNHHMM